MTSLQPLFLSGCHLPLALFCYLFFLHQISHYYHSCAMIHSSLLCIFIHKCCIRAHLIGLSSVSCQKTTTTAGTVVQIRASYSTCSSISLLYLYVRYTQFFLGYFCNSTKACLLSLRYAIALLLTLPPVHQKNCSNSRRSSNTVFFQKGFPLAGRQKTHFMVPVCNQNTVADTM